MRKLLFLILLLFCTTAYGQKIRFTDTSNKWGIVTSDFNHPYLQPSSYSFSNDTVINGLNYRTSQYGYVREDTIVGLVYVKCLNAYNRVVDTNEIVLYNYNLKTGDSVVSKVFYNDSAMFVVKAIDSTLINNVWHRVWDMKLKSGQTATSEYSVIEGIGSTYGPWFPGYAYTFENSISLICFYNNGTHPEVKPKVGFYFDNTSSCLLSINNITTKSSANTTIYPNPANEHSKIIFPYTIQSGNLYITNMLGQVVIQRSIVNNEQVYIGNGINAEGVYFYKVSDKQTGNNFTGRFVYQ